MNKITFEQYPASKLPEDLRQGLEKDAKVRIVIEAESADRQTAEDDMFPGFRHLRQMERKPMTVAETLESIKRIKAQDRPSVTMEEAVARIRALRDEWDN